MSNNILIIFAIEFMLLAITSIIKPNLGMFLYGTGGAILNIGILIINKA